jgi:two-component system NtrC family sensor kinase
MIFSLKTTSYATALFVAGVLGLLLVLGSRQYRSYQQSERIIEQNEKVVFQFATLREHITESLLEEHYRELGEVINEVEELNANISQILQNPSIPDQYRMSFAGQVDLAGIILLLRSASTGVYQKAKMRQLSQEVRILGDRLMLFDRLIVNHVKRKLIGFQSMIIGILALVLIVTVYVLLYWHRQVAVPLFGLIRQLKEVSGGKRHEIIPLRKTGEVAELGTLIQNQLSRRHSIAAKIAGQNCLIDIGAKITKALRHVRTKEEVYLETCKILLANNKYSLAWVGATAGDSTPVPVVSDGSTTMNREEYEECLANLLSAMQQKGSEYDAARQACQQKKPVLIQDILVGLPKGPYKNTPFAAGYANWLALPIICDTELYGVCSIYSPYRDSFAEEEIAFLATMADAMAYSIAAFETNNALQNARALADQMSATVDIMQVRLAPEGTITALNQMAAERFGLKQSEAYGRKWTTLLPADERAAHQRILENMKAGSPITADHREMTIIDNKGNNLIACYSYAPITSENGELVETSWVGVDISDRKWLNQSMVKLYDIQKNMYQNTSDLVAAFTKDGKIREANPAMLKAVNLDTGSIVDRDIAELLFRNEEPPLLFQQALTADEPTDIESATFAFTSHFYRVRILPLDFHDSADSCFLLIARDISNEKRLRNDTVKASRLAAMGELAVDTAHEINNISNVLINYAQLLLEEIDEPGALENKKELLGHLIADGERIAQIVQQILVFSADRSQVVESVSIRKIVEDSFALIKHQLQHDGIRTHIDLPVDLPLVPINVQKMQHVFLNLLHNARDALNQRYTNRDADKRLEIKGETTSINGRQCLHLHFTDWGIGIPQHLITKVFEPFFTTKSPGSGTGLGLSISKGLVQEHKGEIHIASIPDNHTTVTVVLPLASPSPLALSTQMPKDTPLILS